MKAVISILALAGATIAHPAIHARGAVCPDLLYSVPQCCSTNVLNVAALDCRNPSSANDVDDFKDACSGSSAVCCTLPLANQGVLCIDPVGA